MSDNGWVLGVHGFISKGLSCRSSTSIPFMVKSSRIKSEKNDALVLNIDIVPTIMDLESLEIPQNIHGKSIVSMLFKINDYKKALDYEGFGVYGGAKSNIYVISNNMSVLDC